MLAYRTKRTTASCLSDQNPPWPQGWEEPFQARSGLFKDLRAFGRSYTTSYQSAASTFLPKRGGRYEVLERFAGQAAGDVGFEIDTRIYWDAVRADHFAEASADWPTMRCGFELLIDRDPVPRNWNGLTMYACGAGAETTFRRAMDELGNNVTPDTWSIFVNACKSQYGLNAR